MHRILVIEDDDGVRGFLDMGLTQLGYEVTSASTAEEGLKMHEESDWDLVISDMHMPWKSGMDAVLEILDRQPEQRILAISGIPSTAARHSYISTAMMVGVRDYLIKPFSLDELHSKVQSLLQG